MNPVAIRRRFGVVVMAATMAIASMGPAGAGSNAEAMAAHRARAFSLPAEALRGSGPIPEGAEVVFSAKRLPDGTFSLDSLAVVSRLGPADRATILRVVPTATEREDLTLPRSDRVASPATAGQLPFGRPVPAEVDRADLVAPPAAPALGR